MKIQTKLFLFSNLVVGLVMPMQEGQQGISQGSNEVLSIIVKGPEASKLLSLLVSVQEQEVMRSIFLRNKQDTNLIANAEQQKKVQLQDELLVEEDSKAPQASPKKSPKAQELERRARRTAFSSYGYYPLVVEKQ